MARDEWDNYESTLRNIVFLSADVVPVEVANYLKETALHGYWNAKEDTFRQLNHAVSLLPKECADYTIDYLTAKRRERNDWMHVKYGIEDRIHLFPSSHLQGPFLALLRANEDEGLRLVHTLTNTAIDHWRRREQVPDPDGTSHTPLPVTIKLAQGALDFWGDQNVYFWFRPNGNAPHAVSSALMALEVWMEDQVEAGRDVTELFEKVMSGSRCVAVPGMCLGIAHAYPQKCLQAALPIVSVAAIWSMDISRYAADLGGSFSFDPYGHNKVHYQARAERDKRPQRKTEIRHLALYYMLSANNTLREQFQQALASFSENLPFRYEEEKLNPAVIAYRQDDVERHQSYGDLANYRTTQTESGTQVWVEIPKHIKARDAKEQAKFDENTRWMALHNWVTATLKKNRPAEGMGLAQAVATAKELQQTDDFTKPYYAFNDPSAFVGPLDNLRLTSIAGVAAAVLFDFTWAKQQNELDWCRNVLLAAAQMPIGDHFTDDRHSSLLDNPKVTAVRGLGVLVISGEANQQIRELLLRLATDPHFAIWQALLHGLYKAWDKDKILCWNIVSLMLTQSWPTREIHAESYHAMWSEIEAAWVENIFQAHLEFLRSDSLPPLPSFMADPEHVFLSGTASYVLDGMPLEKLADVPAHRAWLLKLADDLLAWTIAENSPADDKPYSRFSDTPYQWNEPFMKWLSSLSRYLSQDELNQHILTPIRQCWPQAPFVTTELLYGWIYRQIGFRDELPIKAQTGWQEICNSVLESEEMIRLQRRGFIHSEVSGAISLIVFVRHGLCLLDDDWPHVKLFTDIIEKWVKTIGHISYAFRCLLTMLSGTGWQLMAEEGLEWLHYLITSSINSTELLRDNRNGERTAELLERLWNEREHDIRNQSLLLQRYSEVVDRLIRAGIPLSGQLQQRLEARKEGTG